MDRAIQIDTFSRFTRVSRETIISFKFYEEYLRTSVDNLKMYEKVPKGELTIVISEKNLNKNKSNNLNESDKKKIKIMLKNISVRDITDLISKEKKVSKKEIYDYCLKIKNEK